MFQKDSVFEEKLSSFRFQQSAFFSSRKVFSYILASEHSSQSFQRVWGFCRGALPPCPFAKRERGECGALALLFGSAQAVIAFV